VDVSAEQLLDVHIPGGEITEAGLRTNVNVGLRYPRVVAVGLGAAAIDNLMEDAATPRSRARSSGSGSSTGRALIGRTSTADGRSIDDRDRDRALREELGDGSYAELRFDEARAVFEEVALRAGFVEFLTLPAYELL
jgi:malate synthase